MKNNLGNLMNVVRIVTEIRQGYNMHYWWLQSVTESLIP